MIRPAPSYPTLENWIARESIPFSLDSSATFSASVDQMVKSLDSSVKLLGFGEAMHGDEDILKLRNRLFQRLVSAYGFTSIALESSFPRARIVNEYFAGLGPPSYEALQDTGFSHGFGRLEANRELVEWMREYNARTSNPIKLRFYGFDSPTEMTHTDSPRHLLAFVLEYLDSMHPASAQAHHQRIRPLLGEDAAWENPAAMMDPTQSVGLSTEATALRIATEELIVELQVRRPELIAGSNEARFSEALHYASSGRQMLTYHATIAASTDDRLARGLGIRDLMMADNLAYIAQREADGGRVLIFAHNMHLQRGQAHWQLGNNMLSWWPAGAQLESMFGSGYAVIGS